MRATGANPAPLDSDEREREAAGTGPARRSPSRWWRELLIVAAFYGIYTAIRDLRGAAPAAVGQAYRNAKRVIALERHLGIYHEQQIQHFFLPERGLIQAFDVWYGTTQFVVTAAVLIALYRWRPDRYLRWRNVLALTTGLALVGYAVFPLMPPRLLPARYGFVDTLSTVGGLWSFSSGPVARLSNQYAAMPSLHVAWALWCALAAGCLLRRRLARVPLALYPLATWLCVIVTANHYITDTVMGALTVVASYGVVRLASRPRRAAGTGPHPRRDPDRSARGPGGGDVLTKRAAPGSRLARPDGSAPPR